MLLEGAAYMYNHVSRKVYCACGRVSRYSYPPELTTVLQTSDDIWKTRVDGFVDRTLELFFPNGVATEVACEDPGTCTTDIQFFKGILHRALATTMKLAPYTADKILPVLKTSAAAAVTTCTGGDNGRMCGFVWSNGTFDDSTAGAQTSVLSALLSVLQSAVVANDTSSGSGNSTSDGGKGGNNSTGSGGGDSMGATVGVSFSALVSGLLVAGFMS